MYNFKFADIGEGIHEGQILKWLFKKGDTVKEGETLVIIETDKVNAEIPSPVDGLITKLGAEVGDTIHVGDTLVLIDDNSESQEDSNKDKSKDKTEEKDKIEVKEKSSEEDDAGGVVGEIEVSDDVIDNSNEEKSNQTPHKRVLATPVARRLASDLEIDIKTVKGTGENGRVLKEDIYSLDQESKQSQNTEKPIYKMPEISSDNVKRVPITKLRKAIVKSMVTSKAIIPHTTLMDEFNVSPLVNFRKEQKSLAEEKGIKLTYMAFIIKAITLTIKDYPIFNASFDHEKEEIIYKNFVNIGIAVDTPDGLIVPNIKDANTKSIFELATEIESLAKAATERTIQLNQIQNGTFTITNYGAFDSTYGAPVIKHPEVAIIGIGRISKKPIVENDSIIIGDVLPISLAIDHRIIDGAEAGRFVMKFKEYLANPMLLLLS